MYSTSTRMEFRARHFLPNASMVQERKMHTHNYAVEISVSGEELDSHGYLMDVDRMEEAAKRIVSSLSGHVINGLPDLGGREPSIEVLANVIWHRFAKYVDTPRVGALRVEVWESESASASYSAAVR